MHSFVIDGPLHGLPGYMDTPVGELSVADWLALMLEDSPEWASEGYRGTVTEGNTWHGMPNYQAR